MGKARLIPSWWEQLGAGLQFLTFFLAFSYPLFAAQSDRELERTGYLLIEEGRWQEAAAVWQELLRQEPRSLARVFNLALCYSNTGRSREAIAALEKLHAHGLFDASSLNLLGKLLSQVRKPEAALPNLHSAVQANPTNEVYQMDLARVLIQISSYDEARKALESALTHLPSSARLHYLKGVLEGELGNFRAAADIYRQLLAFAPEFEPAYITMGNLLLQSGKVEQALDILRRGLDRGLQNPVLISVYCDALLQAYPGQELSELETLLRKQLESDTLKDTSRLLLAKYYLGVGRAKDSLTHLEKVLAVKADHGEALYLSGKALRALGKESIAEMRLARASLELQSNLSQNGGDANGFYRLGLVYLEMGKVDRAIGELRGALQRSPENPLFELALAQALANRSPDSEEAMRHYQRALELAPAAYPVLYQYGLELSRRGAHYQGLSVLKKALNIRATYPLLIEISRVLLLIDRRAEAASFLEQAIRLAPEQAEAYYYLGRRAHSLGNYREAAEFFRKTLARQPEHLEALLKLGEVEFRRGQTESAQDHFEKALSLDSEKVSALFWLGRVKERMGASLQAAQFWQQALKSDPEHTPSHYRLAQHHMRTGDSRQAQVHLRKFQEISSRRKEQMQRPSKKFDPLTP